MIGIICAMKIEADAICETLTSPICETVSGIEFTRGVLHGKEVVMAVSGVGKVFAAICTEVMILRYAPSLVLNSGVGGTLTPALSIGDIAVATSLVQHDMDTSAVGDPVGLVSGINKIYFEADKDAVARLCAAADKVGARTLCGTIASGDQFLADGARKRFIADTFSAIACEMEGAAVAQVAYVNRTPFAVMRAISDSASGDVTMEYPEFLAMAAAKSHAILDAFLAAED